MLQFFQTVMGKAFYEGTMPSLVREISRLNNNLEKLTALQGSGNKTRGTVVVEVSGPAYVKSAPEGVDVDLVVVEPSRDA